MLKTFPAVLRALKSKAARLALTHELAQRVQSNRAMLDHQQFDLVVRLMNCALQNDSSMDEHGVAAALLPLATAFCRKLCTGVIQFAYSCIQERPVWANQQFWEATFYQDVQQDIKALYLPQYERQQSDREPSLSPSSPRENKDLSSSWSKESFRTASSSTSDSSRRSGCHLRPQEPSALEIAAEQMRIWNTLSKEKQEELINNEESTVYSQAIHYANRMVYLRVPLDASQSMKSSLGLEGESNSNSNITNSVAGSDSLDNESGFEEDTSDVGTSVIKFVSRFVDKVCTESSVTQEHIKALHQMIPGVVAMHIETLEAVNRESKRLPPIQKPKILGPTLLQGEEPVMEGLRVYLIPDGREEGTGGILGGPTLLPAEGAVFLTTYRIIFKGTPCDPFACEQVVVRYFPIASLTKEKRISEQYLSHIDQCLHEGLQLRSNTFQLMKIAFDEEVTSENIESFRKWISKVRNPSSIFNTFAFTGHVIVPQTPLHKDKEKHATLRGLAKRTLLRTARKAGLKPKQSSRKQKYLMPSPPTQRKAHLLPGQGSLDVDMERPMSIYDDDVSILDEGEIALSVATDAKSLEKLSERAYCRDYQRLGLGILNGNFTRSKTEQFKVTTINCNYLTCRSYPALLVVPQSISDDSLRKFARCHRQNRFPVVTWRHPRTKAILLRASGFHGKGVMGMLKGHNTPASTSNETTASIEQEKYMSAIVAVTPFANLRHSILPGMNDSSLSITSLVVSSTGGDNFPTLTPEVSRRGNALQRAMNTLRSSGALSRWGSLKERKISNGSIDLSYRPQQRPDSSESGENGSYSLRRAALYVFGEKAQIKGIKTESFPKCDFIPVDFYEVRHVKASFKKLMRACCPSGPVNDPEQAFYKAVENSEWLQQLQSVLQLAGAAVDLLDVQGSSVMICLEDGWDVTTQVIAVAQLLLDPYYRTVEGFRILLEKEWLSFGYRFTHRGNHTAVTQASGFAPIFLQFLDVVHQIHQQFPLSFEFNQYFLKFLAYHYCSNRFRTFMLDAEYERVEAGWLLDDKNKHKLDSGSDDEGNVKFPSSMGVSIWDYIEKKSRRHSLFYNFHYVPDQDDGILRPYSNISNLVIWDYYLKEELGNGPSYDLEDISTELQREDEAELTDGTNRPSNRRIVNSCYDNIMNCQPDSFSHLLEENHRLETELGQIPQKWNVVWNKLEAPMRDSLQRQLSITTQMIRSHGRSIHKRSTIEILVKGKMVGETSQVYSHPHRFEKYNYTTLTYCDFCSHVLWGLVKQGMRCVDCGYTCHEKCLESVPKTCTKYKAITESSNTIQTTKAGSTEASSISSGVSTLQVSSQFYNQFSANVAENRTHEGYLCKRGALLKGWKQRWFVLDSIKHQLRYYDAEDDSHCKGFIDLAEVSSVNPASSVQGAPKKADDKAFFDLKTIRRTYNFLASDAPAAQEWVEKIQSCLQ